MDSAPPLDASPNAGDTASDAGGASESALVWEPRRQLSLAQARKRSDLVRILRMVFTYGAAASIGLLAGYLIQSAFQGSDGRRSFMSNEIVTMINPRFTGRDAAGKAYVITADSAQRRRGQDGVVDLSNPRMVDEGGTQVTAPEGTYDLNEITLNLFRDVLVADASGYVFRSTSARFYVNDGRVEGVDPLRGVGPLGDIRSDTYQITEDGSVMTFEGNVEMTFYPDDPPPDAQRLEDAEAASTPAQVPAQTPDQTPAQTPAQSPGLTDTQDDQNG